MNNKGQSALEYLMTYGWALVVIVVVIAALFAFGIFNPPSAGTCTGLSKLAYRDHAVVDSDLNVVVMNGAGGAISSISCAGVGTSCDCVPTTAASGASFTCSSNGASLSGVYSESMAITYTTTASGLVHTETATCTGSA